MRTLITRHISLVCLSGLLLLLGACTKDDSGRAEPTGTLQLNLTVAGKVIPLHSKAAGDYNPLDISTLWIYKVESDGAGGTAQELIRKYKPATSVPDNLYLVSGRYKVVIEAGDRSEATYTNKTYAGESVFDLNAHRNEDRPDRMQDHERRRPRAVRRNRRAEVRQGPTMPTSALRTTSRRPMRKTDWFPRCSTPRIRPGSSCCRKAPRT
ncbi:MAG: DUF4493 domain-containing protein [Alistipes indistinctus]